MPNEPHDQSDAPDGSHGLPTGCIFLQTVRPVNFEPDFMLGLCAGALHEAGLPVRRARIRVSGDRMIVQDRTLSPSLRERVRAFLGDQPLSHVLLSNEMYGDLHDVVREALPGATVLVQGRDFNSFLPSEVRAAIDGRDLPGKPRAEGTPHWALQNGDPMELYDLVHVRRTRPMLDVADLTPEVPARGMDGDLFIDSLCYYRAPYSGSEQALAGSSSCSFCAIPQPLKRPAAPNLDVVRSQLEAQLAANRQARIFHVIDYGIIAHLADIDAILAELPVSGLELCASVRAPDVLRQRCELEDGVKRFAGHGNRFHIFNIGFESFATGEWDRLNKGYPILQNVECIRYLFELEERFPDAFVFSRWAAHGFIGFTCWTSLADLRANAFFAHALEFSRLVPRFFLRKLRLYRHLPLHALAAADGLLEPGYDDWRLANSYWRGYADEVPYRFRDAKTDRVYRWLARLFLPESAQEQAWHDTLKIALASATDAELRVYAAVVEVIGSGAEGVDDCDDALFDRICEESRRPALELFSSRDVAGDASAFETCAKANVASGAGLERELLALGIKPVAKFECVNEADAPQLAAELAAGGFCAEIVEEVVAPNVCRSAGRLPDLPARGAATVVAGRDPRAVARLRDLIREGQVEQTAELRYEMGRVLGYPECCARAYAAIPTDAHGSDLHLLAASVGRTTGAAHADLDPFAPDAAIEYFPCRLDCSASLDRAARLRAHRGTAYERPDAVLVLSVFERIELTGVRADGAKWTFAGARLHGSSAWARYVLGEIQKGDGVEVLERLLLVRRGSDLLAAIPHGIIVPIHFGHSSPASWLERAFQQLLRIESQRPSARTAEQRAESERTIRELRDLLLSIDSDTVSLTDLRVVEASILAVFETEFAGAIVVELQRAGQAQRSYLKANDIALSYRLPAGAAFSTDIEALCRSVLQRIDDRGDLIASALGD